MPLPDHLVDRVVGVVEVLLPAARGAAGDVVSRVHLRPIIADDPAADCCGGADGGCDVDNDDGDLGGGGDGSDDGDGNKMSPACAENVGTRLAMDARCTRVALFLCCMTVHVLRPCATS